MEHRRHSKKQHSVPNVLLNSWCLEIGVQYALLMRANNPETPIQSSALFLLEPHGFSVM